MSLVKFSQTTNKSFIWLPGSGQMGCFNDVSARKDDAQHRNEVRRRICETHQDEVGTCQDAGRK